MLDLTDSGARILIFFVPNDVLTAIAMLATKLQPALVSPDYLWISGVLSRSHPDRVGCVTTRGHFCLTL